MKWIKAEWFFKIFRNISGIALGPGIVLSREHEWESTARHWAHERCHVLQQERLGWVWFYFVIIYQYARYGYNRAPLEVEAREYAAGWDNFISDYRAMKKEHQDKWA